MLEARLLGQFNVLRDGKPLNIPTRHAQSLFAFLLLNAGKSFRREKLAGLLWPDSSEENARSNLRHELWRLRKTMETADLSLFLVDDLTIAFDPACECTLDVSQFENPPVEKSTTSDLIASLSLYAGELLPGFYDEWVFVERNRLVALYEAKITRLLENLQAEERWPEVLDWGGRWIEFAHWPEPAYRALMYVYASQGDLPKAARIYAHLVQGMQNDLGIKPSEQTQALFKRLKDGWKTESPAHHLPGKPASNRAGERRGDHRSPIDASEPAPALPLVRRTNLPHPLTSFIGRENEIRQVEQLLDRARLVTIIGSGGVGKTRLAIQVAEGRKPHFRDGVWWVELASQLPAGASAKTEPAEGTGERQPQADRPQAEPGKDLVVAQAVMQALRLPESPGLSLLEGLQEYLHDKRLLLVLDNCEHLIEACATLAETLLGNCPEVSILTTSREPLKVPGEKAWRLPSLSLPEGGPASGLTDILQSEAVSLFIERAADILHDYQPDEEEATAITQICQRLDGIPLAIELAAARMSLVSPHEIALRLDDRFNLLTGGGRTALPRHQTLLAAIEWSFDLLSPHEQMLFRRLAVFTGSFTLEAAEALSTCPEIAQERVLTLIGRLVDKSLLNVEPACPETGKTTRYRYPDTIRSFGLMKLDEAQETRWMKDRHADYYVTLAETAEPELLLQNQVRWHRLLQIENENLRAAIEWSADGGKSECALRLAGALLWFWFRSGYNCEGCELALKALAAPSDDQYKQARARALTTAGFLQCLLGDTSAARGCLEQALSILRASGDEASLAWSLQFFGLILAYDKEYDRADAALQEGLAINRKCLQGNANNFIFFLGDVDLQKGDRARARKIYEETASLFRAIHNDGFLAYPLRRLGYLALQQDALPEACRYFKESLELNHQASDRPGMAASLASLASLAICLDRLAIATCLYGAVERQMESLSINLLYPDQVELGHIRTVLTTSLNKATFEAAFTEGWELSEEGAIQVAEKLLEGVEFADLR